LKAAAAPYISVTYDLCHSLCHSKRHKNPVPCFLT
jgi:hypothetical protein